MKIHRIDHVGVNVIDLVSKMKQKGMETFSEIQNYENTYKLCYCRGPEGILLELAEKINQR